MKIQVLQKSAEKAKVAKPVASAPVTMGLKKSDEELQIIWGEIYAPGFPDSQGDFMTPETIREMAYGFMSKSDMYAMDTQHSRQKNGCYIVESFIARDDDTVFIPGAWVAGVKVPDTTLWEMVKSGEINGFSIDGNGTRVDATFTVDMPETLTGETDEVDGEKHLFYVKFSKSGEFLGGKTSPGADGHVHVILRGTVTETENDHCHRFSFVECILDVQEQ